MIEDNEEKTQETIAGDVMHTNITVQENTPTITLTSGLDDGFYIFLGLASIPVTFTLIGFVYMSWQHCHRMSKYCTCCNLCKDLEKRDVNDIYRTYARGWDGEGEYGDGDKVYVSNVNPEYQSYDYVETDLDNRVRDRNSKYSSVNLFAHMLLSKTMLDCEV